MIICMDDASESFVNRRLDLTAVNHGDLHRWWFFSLFNTSRSPILIDTLHVGKRCFRRVPIMTHACTKNAYNNQTSIISNEFLFWSAFFISFARQPTKQRKKQREKLDSQNMNEKCSARGFQRSTTDSELAK